MKLIIPTRIADQVEPRLPDIAPGSIVVHVDQDGASGHPLWAALNAWITPGGVL